MKARVLSDFTDKHTGKRHPKGSDYEATPERISELQAKGFLCEKMEQRPTKKHRGRNNKHSSN